MRRSQGASTSMSGICRPMVSQGQNLWNTRISSWWLWRSHHKDSYPRCVVRSFTSPQRISINGTEACNWMRHSKMDGSYMNWPISRRSCELWEVWPDKSQIERLLDDDGLWRHGGVTLSQALCERKHREEVSTTWAECMSELHLKLHWHVILRNSCLIQDVACVHVCGSNRFAFRDSWKEIVILLCEMSEVNMDLLELEDGCIEEDGMVVPDSVFSGDMSQPNIEGDFPEEGEEEDAGEDDESVDASFLGPDPEIEVEIRFEELYLQENEITLQQPRQRVLGSTIDTFKRMLVEHLYYFCNFYLLKRHFQLMMWIPNKESWERVSFDNTVEEELNRFQERTRLSKYFFRISLNPGITPTSCGRAWTNAVMWGKGRKRSGCWDAQIFITRCSPCCMIWRWRFQELRVECNFEDWSLGFRVGKFRDSGPLRRSSSKIFNYQEIPDGV